jgi:predicted RNA binding protein YcfA (HicA-like mRNA interferase family)
VTPRLPGVSPQKAARALERAGWQLDRVKGSHHVFRHPGRPGRVVVPMHSRDLAKGTLNQIINGSGLARDEFLSLLK